MTILRNRTLPSVMLLMALCLLASCGSSRTSLTARATSHKSEKNTGKSKPQRPAEHIHFNAYSTLPQPTERLLKEADKWIGTPYVYGGNSSDGVDCSGFVLQVYKKALDIKLPRNSAKQQEFCTKLDRDNLREGDLVFFTVRGGDSVGHVGIYIGNGRMIHASSSKGVIISPLSQKYYVDNFHSCGRIEQYYAMLDKSERISSDKALADITPASAKPAEQEKQPMASVEPVLPRQTQPKASAISAVEKKAAPKAAPVKPARKVTAKKATPTGSTMDADRSKVLNSIIEQKADSIFSSR